MRQITKKKQKTSLEKISFRKTIISSLNILNKKEFHVFILVKIKFKPKTQDIDIAMIGANQY